MRPVALLSWVDSLCPVSLIRRKKLIPSDREAMMTKPEKQPPAKVLSVYELMQKFPDEQAAIDYLEGIL
jgi:hypothetical protein